MRWKKATKNSNRSNDKEMKSEGKEKKLIDT